MTDSKATEAKTTSTVDSRTAEAKAAERKEAAEERKVMDARAEERKEAAEHKTTLKKSHAGQYGRAGESGDPVVQKALADLQTAQMNRDSLDVEELAVEVADEAVRAAQQRLNDLGYE